MGIDTLGRVTEQMRYKNYVSPVDDESFGRELFFHGRSREACRNQAQFAGFDSAAREALRREWLAADMQQIAAA